MAPELRALPSLSALPLDGSAVFLRLDLNTPMTADNTVASDARLRAVVPTIQTLIDAGARVGIAAHLGRPKGEVDAALSLMPVVERLSDLLGHDIIFADDCIGDGVRPLVQQLRPGQVMALENLRFAAGEEANDASFARQLAEPFDVYVNDAFAASHRSHASITALPALIRAAGIGPLMHAESSAIAQLMSAPREGTVAIIGGAKVADKIGLLQSLLPKIDMLVLGGAMAYTFLQAQGHNVGSSPVEADKLYAAKELLVRALHRNVTVLLPSDHVVASSFSRSAAAVTTSGVDISQGHMGLDIGPRTRQAFAAAIAGAKHLFWNGPMGVSEWPAFAAGTTSVATAVAKNDGFTVVGGGDSLAALQRLDLLELVSHASTGGGACLELLEHGTLPGIAAVQRANL